MAYIIPEALVTQDQILQNFSRFLTNFEELKALIRDMKIGSEINYRGINIYRHDTIRYYCHKY